MYIHRVILRGLKNSPDRDLTFFNDWTEQPLSNILITGPNGTGKTTLLRVIAALWENFSEWLRLGKTLNPDQQAQGGILRDVALAAIEIRGLVEERGLWLYVARTPDERDQLHRTANGDYAVFVGETRGARGRASFEPKGAAPNWFTDIAARHERLQLGLSEDTMPNMIYLDAEERQIYPPDIKERPGTSAEPLYRWMVTYRPSERREGHIETMFRNLKVRDSEWFKKTLEDTNQFLGEEKRLTDFDQNLRLKVQIGRRRDDYHYLEDLSAGERQCVLLMFMVSRWLMPGGIVLIDEPDLHLHVSLQRQFIRALERVVERSSGQMIVTSHSPTLWEEYNARQRFTFGVEEWQHDRLAE